MPDQKRRRRGQRRTSRPRTGGVATLPRSAHLGTRSRESGWGPKLRPRTWRRVRRWLFIGAAGIFAAAIILSFALSSFPAGLSSQTTFDLTARVDYVGTPVEDTEVPFHRTIGQPILYADTPPNSGNHWISWAQCGIYDEEINDEYLVHNMEHGHLIISYNLNSVDATRLVALAEDLPDLERYAVVRPYSKIDPNTVAMTAWGVSEHVQGVDEEKIKGFYDTNYRNEYSHETSQLGRAIPCR